MPSGPAAFILVYCRDHREIAGHAQDARSDCEPCGPRARPIADEFGRQRQAHSSRAGRHRARTGARAHFPARLSRFPGSLRGPCVHRHAHRATPWLRPSRRSHPTKTPPPEFQPPGSKNPFESLILFPPRTDVDAHPRIAPCCCRWILAPARRRRPVQLDPRRRGRDFSKRLTVPARHRPNDGGDRRRRRRSARPPSARGAHARHAATPHPGFIDPNTCSR